MSTNPEPAPGASPFANTRLSLIQRPPDSMVPEDAQGEFYQIYWYPMYAFIRHQGASHEEAQDCVQDFVSVQLIEKQQLLKWDQALNKGFRSFLKALLDRFWKNQLRDHKTGRHRGVSVPIDEEEVRTRYEGEDALRTDDSADQLFDRRWAIALCNRARAEAEEIYRIDGREKEFHLLSRSLAARAGVESEELSYDDIGAQLGTNANNVKQLMRNFKKCLRGVLNREVREFVSPDEIRDECVFIFQLGYEKS